MRHTELLLYNKSAFEYSQYVSTLVLTEGLLFQLHGVIQTSDRTQSNFSKEICHIIDSVSNNERDMLQVKRHVYRWYRTKEQASGDILL